MFPSFPTRCLAGLLLVLAIAVSASAEWKESVLYSFQGIPDGQAPAGAIVFDSAGNIYGTTGEGGANNCRSANQCGTVYQLTPPAKKSDPWTETVLHIFKGNAGNDGATPFGGVVIDSAGNLYGTTGYGGTGNCVLLGILMGCGTVFEFSPPAQKGGAWTETILYSFQGGKDGYLPNGDLVFDAAGNLYGATMFGGGQGTSCNPYYQYCGTVFGLSPPKKRGGAWKENVLYSFKGNKSGKPSGDGANPNGGLILDNSGALYGTTYFGGDNKQGTCEGGAGGTGCGTVFMLSPPAKKGAPWTETVLHRFQGGTKDGGNPVAGVILDSTNNLFGTTYAGPQNGFGTVFEVAKPAGKSQVWMEKLLYRFTDGNDGGYPDAGLALDSQGTFWGTTIGGAGFHGDVFQLKPPTRRGAEWTESDLYRFLGAPDGAHPASKLLLKSDHIYGTTSWGGTGQSCQGGCGTVFEVTP